MRKKESNSFRLDVIEENRFNSLDEECILKESPQGFPSSDQNSEKKTERRFSFVNDFQFSLLPNCNAPETELLRSRRYTVIVMWLGCGCDVAVVRSDLSLKMSGIGDFLLMWL